MCLRERFVSAWLGVANGAWIAGLGLAGGMPASYAVAAALLAGDCAMLARAAGERRRKAPSG